MPTMECQNLVKEGNLEGDVWKMLPPDTFVTSTPRLVSRNTRIVAAVHPDLEYGDPIKHDGWFLSDFYAMNYLYKDQGASQVWLTAAEPMALLKKYGDFLHGNPYHERKIVLSKDLINANQLTKPTVVKPEAMIQRFKEEIRKAAEAADRDGGNVLLLIFCHGLKEVAFALNNQSDTDVFRVEDLREVVSPRTRVTLLSTSCYSGGWLVHSNVNVTGIAAASPDEESLSWVESPIKNRHCGSMFISAVIGALTDTTSELLAKEERETPSGSSHSGKPLQPNAPSEMQTATYNAFCRSIVDVLDSRLYRMIQYQNFTFSAQDDDWEAPWTDRTGMQLTDYERRWNRLAGVQYAGSQEKKEHADPSPLNPTFQAGGSHGRERSGAVFRPSSSDSGGLGQSNLATKERVRRLARLFIKTCPGDEIAPRGRLVYWMMRHCIETGEADYSSKAWNIFALVRYRCELGRLADHLVRVLGLPRPGGKSFFSWNSKGPEERDADLQSKGYKIFAWLLPKGLPPRPEQGPTFDRFARYLSLAVTLARKDEETTMEIIEQINRAIYAPVEENKQRLLADPEVRQRGREWVRSIGRRARESLSPTKRAPGPSLGQEPQ